MAPARPASDIVFILFHYTDKTRYRSGAKARERKKSNHLYCIPGLSNRHSLSAYEREITHVYYAILRGLEGMNVATNSIART